MMNFIYTLVALATGILYGSAGVFISRRKMSDIKKIFAWLGMIPLLWICATVAILCEEKINTSHIFSFITQITTAAIVIYGIFWGIVISLSSEVKQAFKEKKENLTLAGTAGLTNLPLILWMILFIGSPFNCWNSLAFAVFLGFTITTMLWIVFSTVSWEINRQKTKNPCI